MKFIKGTRTQNNAGGRFKAVQSGPRNRLRQVAANKAALVKRLKSLKSDSVRGKLSNRKLLAKNNSASARGMIQTNMVDARVRLMQKALESPTVIVDARQKLTKQKDAREKIQERRLHLTSRNATHNISLPRGHPNNLGRVKIDRRGILTVKSILDERASSHHAGFRDRRPPPPVNQRRFEDVERRRSSNTFNSDLNTFRSDRPIEDIRPIRRDSRVSRRPVSSPQPLRRPSEHSMRPTRVNEKPYSRPIAMDFEDSMEWEDTNRYSPAPVMRRNMGNSAFDHNDYDQDELLDRNSRNHRGLSETLRSRLDSHQTAMAKRARPIGHKIVVSNLEPSVTSEDIRELFADIGDLLESRVIRPGVAEVIYERRADAIQAVDIYHNRQLDGRPMKCDMVRSAGSSTGPIHGPNRRVPSRGADMYKPSAYVTYDIDAVHTALFNK